MMMLLRFGDTIRRAAMVALRRRKAMEAGQMKVIGSWEKQEKTETKQK
jgi:hypothetical protein